MDKNPQVKSFKTFEQQLQILKDRKLDIDIDALSFLQTHNYYRFSGYFFHDLINRKTKNEQFKQGCKFSVYYHQYNFDRKLRTILFSVIADVEVRLRTYLAYFIAEKYGPLGHKDKSNFKLSVLYRNKHRDLFDEIQGRLVESHKNEKDRDFVKHHIIEKSETFPIWVDIELLSFGSISKFFYILKDQDLVDFDNRFTRIGVPKILTWIDELSILRNNLAHFYRTYRVNYSSIEVNSPYSGVDGFTIFSRILTIKDFLQANEDWTNFVTSFGCLVNEYKMLIEMEGIGLPIKWSEYLNLPYRPSRFQKLHHT